MKPLTLKNLTIGIILTASSAIYSQSDSVITYYPDEISVSYENGTIQIINTDSLKPVSVFNIKNVEDIYKISFLSDSIISLSNRYKSDFNLNVNKITGVSIKSGSYSILGICIGVLTGFGVGAAIGSSIGSAIYNGNVYGETNGAWIGGISGMIIGGIFGRIIGSNISSYKTYDLQKSYKDNKFELERILCIDKKNRKQKLND